MPELPDVHVITEYLRAHVVGQTIVAVEHVGPIVMRNLLTGDVASVLIGRRFESAKRRGKFLLLGLDNGTQMVVNFMLFGRLMLCSPTTRIGKRALYVAMRQVLTEAIDALRQRVGDNIHEEVRDVLLVHGRSGQPYPRCGTAISQVSANQRITSFCRTCQPGTLIRQS